MANENLAKNDCLTNWITSEEINDDCYSEVTVSSTLAAQMVEDFEATDVCGSLSDPSPSSSGHNVIKIDNKGSVHLTLNGVSSDILAKMKFNPHDSTVKQNSPEVVMCGTVSSSRLECDAVRFTDSNHSDVFISQPPLRFDTSVLQIIPRRLWLAQPPIRPLDVLQKPVQYVTICHTATETASTSAEMILLIRIFQQFHVESRKWKDIAYNFMIGGDGNVYEGRGFNYLGHHTHNHNKRAISIAIVGCYMNTLPSAASIELCKKLIAKGVEDGHIADDYKLIGHCQSTMTESPGRMLFEEIKTWPHWTENAF